MTVPTLTQEQLKEILHYDPETGHFTWIVSQNNRSVAGKRAGHLAQNGYIRIGFKGNEYLGHRLAWFYSYGEWPKHNIDHLNQNRSDNRLENLRDATHSQNSRNMRKSSRNKSGTIGVSWYARDSKWQAHIMTDSGLVNLGKFDTIEQAKNARKEAEKKHGYLPAHGS